MRALDTNVLARVFIDDADDARGAKQRPAAGGGGCEGGWVGVRGAGGTVGMRGNFRPSDSSSTSILAPAPMPSRRRNAAGKTIWPFEETTSVGMFVSKAG